MTGVNGGVGWQTHPLDLNICNNNFKCIDCMEKNLVKTCKITSIANTCKQTLHTRFKLRFCF